MPKAPSIDMRSALIAFAGQSVVFGLLLIWLYIEYGTDGLRLSQFKVYSLGSFIGIWVTVSVLLSTRVLNLLAIILLSLLGFCLFLLVGTFRYVFVEGFDSWNHAISGPALISTSLILNGGFLSLFAIIAYLISKAIERILNRIWPTMPFE